MRSGTTTRSIPSTLEPPPHSGNSGSIKRSKSRSATRDVGAVSTRSKSSRPGWNGRNIPGAVIKERRLPAQPKVLRRKIKGVVNTKLPDYVLRKLQHRSRPKIRNAIHSGPQKRMVSASRALQHPSTLDRALENIDPVKDSMGHIIDQLYPGANFNEEAKAVEDQKGAAEGNKQAEKKMGRNGSLLPSIQPKNSRPTSSNDQNFIGRASRKSSSASALGMTPELVMAMQMELKALRKEVHELHVENSRLKNKVRELTEVSPKRETITKKEKRLEGSPVQRRRNTSRAEAHLPSAKPGSNRPNESLSKSRAEDLDDSKGKNSKVKAVSKADRKPKEDRDDAEAPRKVIAETPSSELKSTSESNSPGGIAKGEEAHEEGGDADDDYDDDHGDEYSDDHFEVETAEDSQADAKRASEEQNTTEASTSREHGDTGPDLSSKFKDAGSVNASLKIPTDNPAAEQTSDGEW